MEYRKAITYQSFMQLPPATRLQHSQFFKTTYPEYFPVILQVMHSNKQIPLKMCKFLINRKRSIITQQETIKQFVLKHSHGAINKTDQIVFVHFGKLVNQKMTVSEFLESCYRDHEGDGWLHYKAVTQDVYG